jgi:hypothetical protein
MLRMDKDITKKEKIARVYEVMKEVKIIFINFEDCKILQINIFLNKLNLEKCQDNLIGIFGKKGISGGEKRRLAFASEV